LVLDASLLSLNIIMNKIITASWENKKNKDAELLMNIGLVDLGEITFGSQKGF